MSALIKYTRLRAQSVSIPFVCCVFFWLCLLAPAIAIAQEKPVEVQTTGYLRLSVKITVKERLKGLQRKRFFLIKVTPEKSAAVSALMEKISNRPFISRKCFYAGKASPEFIEWLTKGDCESVYCRLIEEEYITGTNYVREFHKAFELSTKKYKSPKLGRLWLTTYLTGFIRDGFYCEKKDALDALIAEAQLASSGPVNSVMTDRSGTAYFTGLTPGKYLVTNLIPTEVGASIPTEVDASSILWKCEVDIDPGKNLLDITDTTETCVVQRPISACDASKQSAWIR